MGCGSCSSSRGCSTSGTPTGCKNNGHCATGGCNKLNVFDWLADVELPAGQVEFDCMEIRFKNSRKEFCRNVNNLSLNVGDVIAVEASPGHDIGIVSLTGELVRLQMKKRNVDQRSLDIKKIYRKAKQNDIDKWKEAQTLETTAMFKSRTLALALGLKMKISDVEYQGDKTKAIFYYTADERVDFRELIKKMAEEFKVRIEMKQIGARQEAGRLGGIGSCGRELCCSTWLTDFRSVATSAARYQQLSLNPLKLAGQCGKLKCCLNYELDSYLDAIKDFPDINVRLKAKRGEYFHQKTDIFRRMMWYSHTEEPSKFIPLEVDTVKELIELNKKGELPEEILAEVEDEPQEKRPDYENVVGQDSLTRFDNKKRKKKRPNNNNRNNNNNRGPQGNRNNNNSNNNNRNNNSNNNNRPPRNPNNPR